LIFGGDFMKRRHFQRVFLALAALAASGACADAESASRGSAGSGAIRALFSISGALVVNISAVNKSKIPTNADVGCRVFWQASNNSGNSFVEFRHYRTKAQVTASTITCKVIVPYTVIVSDPNAITISADGAIELNVSQLAAASVEGVTAAAVPGSTVPTTATVRVPRFSFTLPPDNSTVTTNFSTAM
jgi:hypothetical protein